MASFESAPDPHLYGYFRGIAYAMGTIRKETWCSFGKETANPAFHEVSLGRNHRPL